MVSTWPHHGRDSGMSAPSRPGVGEGSQGRTPPGSSTHGDCANARPEPGAGGHPQSLAFPHSPCTAHASSAPALSRGLGPCTSLFRALTAPTPGDQPTLSKHAPRTLYKPCRSTISSKTVYLRVGVPQSRTRGERAAPSGRCACPAWAQSVRRAVHSLHLIQPAALRHNPHAVEAAHGVLRRNAGAELGEPANHSGGAQRALFESVAFHTGMPRHVTQCYIEVAWRPLADACWPPLGLAAPAFRSPNDVREHHSHAGEGVRDRHVAHRLRALPPGGCEGVCVGWQQCFRSQHCQRTHAAPLGRFCCHAGARAGTQGWCPARPITHQRSSLSCRAMCSGTMDVSSVSEMCRSSSACARQRPAGEPCSTHRLCQVPPPDAGSHTTCGTNTAIYLFACLIDLSHEAHHVAREQVGLRLAPLPLQLCTGCGEMHQS